MRTIKFKFGMIVVVVACCTAPLAAQTDGSNTTPPAQFSLGSSPATAPSTAINYRLSDPLPQSVDAPNVEKHAWHHFSDASGSQSSRRQPQPSGADSNFSEINFSDQSFEAISNAVADAVANAFQPNKNHFAPQSAPQFGTTAKPITETPLPPLDVESHHEFSDIPPTGIRGHFSDASPTALKNPAAITTNGPLQPIRVAPGEVPGLKLKHVSGAKFADPEKFLESRSFKFASPNQFLDEETRQRESAAREKLQFVSSQKKRNPRQSEDAANDSNSANTAKKIAEDEDLQRLYVADVYAPISLNPFGNLEQVDRGGILQERQPIMFADAPAGTYAELTGNYFQAHLASWKAHQLYHKPLYFEETNLERYGNELCYQNVASTMHFFTSAALLPYKIGQTPPNTCVTTLGHHRPGECVPYQVHRGEHSRRGMIYQAIPIIAISL